MVIFRRAEVLSPKVLLLMAVGFTITCLTLSYVQLQTKNAMIKEFNGQIVSIEELMLRNERRQVESLSSLQKMVVSSIKRLVPANSSMVGQENATNMMTLEQMRRRDRIKEVCQKYASIDRQPKVWTRFRGVGQTYSQEINPNAFLIATVPHTIICYNHKVASSTWMAHFAKLLGNKVFWDQLSHSGKFYRITDRMSPSSSQQLLETISNADYFTFTVVRHPFDRLLSAYRDRILNGCTSQSKNYVPRVFSLTRPSLLRLGSAKLFDKITGCITVFPTFQEFVSYVAAKPSEHEPHWLPYTKHCAPCVMDYDAVIKLETASEDEQFVMSQSKMDLYSQLEYRHISNKGETETLRADYYSNVTCVLMDRLGAVYKMDLEMFDYTSDPFKQFCISDADA